MNPVRRFSDETGMYIDWNQLQDLPKIDTLVDVGVGPHGTPELYERFTEAGIILIDPLIESSVAIKNQLHHRKVTFVCAAAGKSKGQQVINVETTLERSTFLTVTSLNFEGNPVEQRLVEIKTLDEIIEDVQNSHFGSCGNLGIKIDTEGFELDVVMGAKKTLPKAKFVIAEVRHNHVTFEGGYKFHEFNREMSAQGFVLTKILTAKPFIADLCFQPLADL
jgi:FkbM family methyltransferase